MEGLMPVTNELYSKQNLGQTWTNKPYTKYQTAQKTWGWLHLPFGEPRKTINDWDRPPQKTTGSILEIGSAAGAAYSFINESGLIDTSDYTGIEISDQGINFCRKNYPKATWLKQNVAELKLERNYDYFFERIAIHHMPNPIKIYDNILGHIDKAVSTGFVSCMNGSTISDLEIARYRHANGDYVYFDIINPFEVIEVFFEHGFNEISFHYWGPHEKVDSDPCGHQYLDPEINLEKRVIGRTTLHAVKAAPSKRKIHFVARKPLNPLNFPKWVKVNNMIQDRLHRMSGKRDGVLYESLYYPV